MIISNFYKLLPQKQVLSVKCLLVTFKKHCVTELSSKPLFFKKKGANLQVFSLNILII